MRTIPFACRFPPGTTGLPPGAPRVAGPPQPAVATLTLESIMMGATTLLAAASFAMIAYFVCCLRRNVRRAAYSAFQSAPNKVPPTVPLARIEPDGTSFVMHGVFVGEQVGSKKSAQRLHLPVHTGARKHGNERQALLSDAAF